MLETISDTTEKYIYCHQGSVNGYITEVASFGVRRDTRPTFKATSLLFLDRLRHVIYQNVGLGKNFWMKYNFSSADLRVITYDVTYDLRQS